MKRNYASKLNALTVKVFFIASVIFAFNLTAIAQEPSHRVTFKNGSISYQGVIAGDVRDCRLSHRLPSVPRPFKAR